MPDCIKANECGLVKMFFSTPELVLCLCQVLHDADLLVLSQVSSCLNTLALHTFFIFHGMTLSQISSGIFLLSSLSLPAFRLALFIPSLKITKLSCSFDVATAHSDMRSLQRVLSRLPRISELNITTYTAIEEDIAESELQELNHTFSNLMFALDPYKNLLILSDGYFSLSKHRRMVHPKKLGNFPFAIRGLWSLIALSPLICSFLLAHGLVKVSATVESALSDPRIRDFQDERIHKDIGRCRMLPRAVRITSPMLPSNFLSLKKWTMVTFNESVTTTLYIKPIAFLDDEKWHLILSSLQFSHLKYLTIEPRANISLTTIVLFVNRHPTIQSLELFHHSIPYSSYPPGPDTTLSLAPNSLNNLRTLQASSRLIHLLLKSVPGPLPNLHDISIGPKIQRDYRYWHGHGMYPDKRAKVENPFDFAALERALMTVRKCARAGLELGVTLPGGSVAMKWLALSAAAGMSKLHVKTLVIGTERGISLPSPVIPLLADWIASMFVTTELRMIQFKPWVIVSESKKAEFERKIREVTGTEDVAVDFSVGMYIY